MPKKSAAQVKRDYHLYLFLCSLWIPYLAFFLYWMTKEDCLIQLGLIAMILPAIFQPLFWYMVLGIVLYTACSVAADDGQERTLSYRPNRRRPW